MAEGISHNSQYLKNPTRNWIAVGVGLHVYLGPIVRNSVRQRFLDLYSKSNPQPLPPNQVFNQVFADFVYNHREASKVEKKDDFEKYDMSALISFVRFSSQLCFTDLQKAAADEVRVAVRNAFSHIDTDYMSAFDTEEKVKSCFSKMIDLAKQINSSDSSDMEKLKKLEEVPSTGLQLGADTPVFEAISAEYERNQASIFKELEAFRLTITSKIDAIDPKIDNISKEQEKQGKELEKQGKEQEKQGKELENQGKEQEKQGKELEVQGKMMRTLMHLIYRAVANSGNLGGHVILGGDNVPPLVDIGLSDGACALPAPLLATGMIEIPDKHFELTKSEKEDCLITAYKMAWYKHFDVQEHAVHKDDPKSIVWILTQHKDDDEKRMKQLKRKKRAQFKCEVIDVTNLDNHELYEKIFYDDDGPTNLILNFYKSDSECQQKLSDLYFDICPIPGFGCKLTMDGGNFKFIELRETWSSTLNGAYLMSSVENSGYTWKEKVKRLCTSNVICRGKVYNILVLSGTHGSKNGSVSGFTHQHLLDDDQFKVDLGFANDLEEEMNKIGFELDIKVANMRDFCKPLRPKNDLCEFVRGNNPKMVVMAWSYSNNGKFYIF